MIKIVIFDWVGIIVDFGCMVFVYVFRNVFLEKGI